MTQTAAQTPALPPGVHVADVGPMARWQEYAVAHPLSPKPVKGKHFLHDGLGLTGMEVSINSLPAGRTVPFYHRHRRHEELYLFLGGEGEFDVDGVRFPVSTGSAVRVPPAVKRSWRSTGNTPLYYIVIQAVADTLEAHGIHDGEICPGIPWQTPGGAS